MKPESDAFEIALDALELTFVPPVCSVSGGANRL
jgi:hypothetical protein